MTVAEARKLLASLPDSAPLCFSLADESGVVLEIGQIDLVAATRAPDGYIVTDDGAAPDAMRVAVIA